MTVQQIAGRFADDTRLKMLARALESTQRAVWVKGLAGSARALLAPAIIEATRKPVVFIIPDKEQAAYLFNDLQKVLPTHKVLFFPASYRAAYQVEETDNANVGMRTEVLDEWRNAHTKPPVCVTYPAALSEKVITRQGLAAHSLQVSAGETLSPEFLEEVLQTYQFSRVDYVYEPGQYAVRGGIVDVFSFGQEYPVRIEFLGDDVESLRQFNPADQLSVHRLKQASIIPNVQQKFTDEKRQSLLEFMGRDTLVFVEDREAALSQCDSAYAQTEAAYQRIDSPLKHLQPQALFLSGEALGNELNQHPAIYERIFPGMPDLQQVVFNQIPQPAFNKNFELLVKTLKEQHESGYANLLFAGNTKQVERLQRIFSDLRVSVNLTPVNTELSAGFIDRDLQLACFTDHEIFERYHRFYLREGYKKNKEALTLKELTSLSPGDFVVHIDHGVGKFSGLEKLMVNGKEQEAIRLIYRDNDILYVSIHSLHRISKYTGKEGAPPSVNKLGSATWGKLKSKTKARVKEIAFDLISLYAKRKTKTGFAFSPDGYLQTELEASFMYEDTPDQFKATQDVKRDMESEIPMDRLVCGDVGFGKTEIAMRAAFKAVCDSKQVAVLVPTTILSLQHYKSFKERLKDFPCRVAYINRFVSTAKQREILKDLADGKIDILVGTHRLTNKGVKFKDLGLLIIDEEQKFGVGVKDKLKTLKENVDTLTLTATPIPRTLQFSLMGARDLSVINTPPPNRYPVETVLRGFNEEIIRDAIQEEVARGGQVYFVHNKVHNIREIAGMIQRLVPDAKVAIGHGQMEGEKLERVMSDFIDGLYDVLVATTIIESGIDIPNANTIIINEAHQFGLSDLHQLRGRVGRSNKRAYCILLAPPLNLLPADARRRLQAIEQFSELGSGMNIAMRDLDIRGAGDLLGGEQSGFINDIGMETYQKILDEAIRELKETTFKELYAEELERQQREFVADCQIETDLEILIPDDYVPETEERLRLYRELDDLNSETDLAHFAAGMQDRFGPVPEQTAELFNTLRLRWLGKKGGCEKILLKGEKMFISFVSDPESSFYKSPVFDRVLQFLKDAPKSFKMYEKDGGLRLSCPEVRTIRQALDLLQEITGLKLEEVVAETDQVSE